MSLAAGGLSSGEGSAQRPQDMESRLIRDLTGRFDEVEARLGSRLDALEDALARERTYAPPVRTMDSVLNQALDTAMSLMRADRGNIQIADQYGCLRIAVQAGFSEEFLEYFEEVDDDAAACGRAVRQHAQIVINDVTTERGFAPHRGIAASSGFRAVQSTPLVDASGVLRGVLSTHYRQPYQPPAHDLEVMRRLGVLIGQTISSSSAWPEEPFGAAANGASADGSPAARLFPAV